MFKSDGRLKDKAIDFYEQYFSNEVGLVYIGGLAISPEGKSSSKSLLLNSKEKGLGLQKIINVASKYNTKIAVQLMHAGRQTKSSEINFSIVAPSAIPCPIVKELPIELSHQDIKRIVKDFGNSAYVAELSGADLIEIHAAHGYLISGFLSPYSNKRTDIYGGTFENRFRFLSEILDEVNKKVKIPVGIRINCVENVTDGLKIDDVIKGIKKVIQNKISFISISGGVYSQNDIIMPSRNQKSLWENYGIEIKKNFKIPLFLAGNIDSISMADNLIAKDAADLVLMGRSLIADPAILVKSIENRESEIKNCIDCKLCKYHSLKLDSLFCPFNPVLQNLYKEQVRKIIKEKNIKLN